MAGIDLHLHTTASDGMLEPEQLVDLAVERGLDTIAITDHDTLEGIQPAVLQAQRYEGFTVIPGIELSTHSPGSELHMLGYFIDYLDPVLISVCQRMRSDRLERARSMVSKLNNLGVNISWARVAEIAGRSNIGRPHIARALLEAGHISTFEEAFTLYLARGRPAYVERFKITPVEAIDIILKSGGLPVLAHPLLVKDYETVITELSIKGLEGLEVYYKDFAADERQRLAGLAEKLNLVATGGSDYHGLDDINEVLPGKADVPGSVLDRLVSRALQKGIKDIPEEIRRRC